MERNRLTVVLLKILDIYSFNKFAKIKEIAFTHLICAIELLSTYHLLGKEKVGEQHNSFRVIQYLLKLVKSANAHLALAQSPKNF